MQPTLFDLNIKTIKDIGNPVTYKGLNSFHKYWGKKPTESIAYFIQNFTKESDIVLDPFVGSGFISRECLSRNRRFIGIDINPIAIEHTNFILDLPESSEFKLAIKQIEKKVKQKIEKTYLLDNGKIASHYLWDKEKLLQVWMKNEMSRKKIVLEPTHFDLEQSTNFSDYSVRNIRELTFFTNSRINATQQMSIYDLFTRRALFNMDLLLDEIILFPKKIQRALLLTLTSSSGQMSSMVFAITNRGKTKNKISEKIEVGSCQYPHVNAPPIFTHTAPAIFTNDVSLSRWVWMQIGYSVKVVFGAVAPPLSSVPCSGPCSWRPGWWSTIKNDMHLTAS